MSCEIAIKAENIGKLYKVFKKPSDRLWKELNKGSNISYSQFWAIRNINFELMKGETLGIVGRNGAGKSTLLQIICGTIEPTEGKVNLNGRIGALLELGSGFNPEFSGLENAELNAAILGLSKKEIKEKISEIVSFADIGDFIKQPVKNYSSGMVMRLAFAVQAHINPSILVVDEALAVGDEMFQRKCFARLEKLKAKGTSILLVSHSASQIIRHCDKVMMLEKGKKIIEGPAQRTTEIYQQLIQIEKDKWDDVLNGQPKVDQTKRQLSVKGEREREKIDNWKEATYYDEELIAERGIVYEEKDIKFEGIKVIEPGSMKRINIIRKGKDFDVRIKFEALVTMEGIRIGCFIGDKEGCKLGGLAYPEEASRSFPIEKGEKYEINFEFNNILWPGLYFVGFGITDTKKAGYFLARRIDVEAIRIIDDNKVNIGQVSMKRGKE